MDSPYTKSQGFDQTPIMYSGYLIISLVLHSLQLPFSWAKHFQMQLQKYVWSIFREGKILVLPPFQKNKLGEKTVHFMSVSSTFYVHPH